MLKAAIPLLRVGSIRSALDFYCGKLGFAVRSTYQPAPAREDPSYCVLERDDALIHVSSFTGDGLQGNVVTIAVTGIEALHDELVRAGVDVGLGLMDQSWGDRELYVCDPAGNTVRFQSS